MTTPAYQTGSTGSPVSNSSDQSWHSAQSTASSYAAVRISSDGRRNSENSRIASSNQPIPQSAPPLPQNATVGVYDANSREFYSHTNNDIARWSSRRAAWVVEHKDLVLQAISDIAPSAIQGIAPFMPVPADKWLNVAGISLQGTKAAVEIGEQIKRRLGGENIDGVKLFAGLGRLASVATNAAAASLDSESQIAKTLGGVGTGTAMAATGADLVHDMHTKPARQQQGDPELGPFSMASLATRVAELSDYPSQSNQSQYATPSQYAPSQSNQSQYATPSQYAPSQSNQSQYASAESSQSQYASAVPSQSAAPPWHADIALDGQTRYTQDYARWYVESGTTEHRADASVETRAAAEYHRTNQEYAANNPNYGASSRPYSSGSVDYAAEARARRRAGQNATQGTASHRSAR
ncbi:hypothetical protein [Streptomyces sp. NPDC017991]|uniref:hypothetical protein n=1 Tax=Streptomyces sp. NPDC017991 TaxID=3365026 RepID=UPI0037A5F1E9